MSTTTMTPVLAAIVNAAETARNEGKNARAIARLTRKEGVLAPADSAPKGVVMDDVVWIQYNNAVKYLYLSCVNFNSNQQKDRAKGLSDTVYTSLQALLELVDPSIKMSELKAIEGEKGSTLAIVADCLALAKTARAYDDPDALYREENVAVGRFIRELEKRLYIIAKGTTFAEDWERDWNRAKNQIPRQIAKAKETGERLAAELKVAKEAAEHAKTKKAKEAAANDVAALEEAVKANADKQTRLAKKLEDAEEAYKNAKELAEKSAKATAEVAKAATKAAPKAAKAEAAA